MTSGADLFVVCKQCGSEVSPYVTECPYCGNRLRRRAPKLPRVHGPSKPEPTRGALKSLLGRSGRPAQRTSTRPSRSFGGGGGSGLLRPYTTIALVLVSCAAWIACHAEPTIWLHTAILGPLGGDWWRLFSAELVYLFPGLYVLVTLVALGLFGWLFERRHGPVVTLALFFGAGLSGELVALALYPAPILTGGAGGALALLAAWAAPDLLATRSDSYYEGDLLGAGAIAALLVAIGFAYAGTAGTWVSTLAGGAIGLLVGLGLARGGAVEA